MKKYLLFLIGICLSFISQDLIAQNSVEVTVFRDLNGNGLDDDFATVGSLLTTEIFLVEAGGMVYNYTGLVAGVYTFDESGAGLPDGTYTLQYVETAWTPAAINVGMEVFAITQLTGDNDVDPVSGISAAFVLAGGSQMVTDVDLGLYFVTAIGDFVWEDINGDGLQDGELANGIDGVSVSLLDGFGAQAVDTDNNPVPAQLTAGGGDYLFGNLAPGAYIVQFSLPTVGGFTWYATTFNAAPLSNDSDADPNNSFQSIVYNVGPDIIYNENIDAGFIVPSNIGDFVWEDFNGNGIQGAAGIDGVTIRLLDDTGVQATGADGLLVPDQITAVGGIYQFTLVTPGDYQVEFNLPAPIGGVNWYPTEFAIHTDANDPDDDSDANNMMGPDFLRSHVITIESGDTDEELRIDAGFWLPAKIGNKVFCDENGNGIDDDGVAGVDDINVNLYDVSTGAIALDADGVAQPLTKTAGGGMYEFDLVPPGEYYVEFSFAGAPGPANPPFVFTLQDEGADDTADSDVNPMPGGMFGQTPTIEITSQDIDEETKWDAGVFQLISISGTVFYDDDGSTTQNGTEGGPAGVLMNLYNADDNSKIDDVLTTGGDYEFPSNPGIQIGPGNYYIEIDITAFSGVLNGAEPCPGSNNANDMVDNDDNGSDGIPAQSTPFTVLSNCDPTTPPLVDYVDFCYFFNCNIPNPLASTVCEQIADADIICDINQLSSFCAIMPSANSPQPQPQPLCQNSDNNGGGAHNASWFAFVAYGGSYTVTVTPSNCSGSTTAQEGVQLGLYTDCTFSEAVYCDPGCSTNPVSFDSSVLTEGQTYYFFIDGCSGSVCSYEVDITGTPTPPNLTPTDMCIDNGGTIECIDGNTYCPNADVNFLVQGVELTVDHSWTITTVSGGPFVGDAAPMTIDGMLPVTFENEGEYIVCINNINNGCQNWSGNFCRTVIIAGLDDEEFDTQNICDIADFDVTTLMDDDATNPVDPNGDATDGWQDPATAFMIGSNTAMITTAQGCMYEQEVELALFPVSDVGLVDMTFCRDDLPITIDGTQYTEATFGGAITFSLPNIPLVNTTDENECDSLIDIELEILDIFNGTLTEGICTPDGVILEFAYDISLSTDISFITWVWTDPSGSDLPDDTFNPTDILDNIAPTSTGSGIYKLTGTVVKDGVTCTFEYMVDIDFEALLPPMPTITGPPLMICESDSIQTYTASDFGDAFNYIWEVPSGVTVLSGGGLSDQTVQINWAGNTGGTISLTGVNGCGEGDPTSINITLVPLLSPDFSVTAEVCQDSSTVIMFSGDQTDIDSYTWDFDGGTINNATGGNGPGPHEVSWADGGVDHTITLTVLHNGGCTSTETFQVVSTIAPLAAPTVNCNPATGEVSFTWADVTGATGYDVIVTSTDSNGDLHTGTLNGNTFTVTGLNEGETVTIQLIVFTGDACVMVVGTAPGCTSQTCVAPTITLDAGGGPGTLISVCTADIVGNIDISSVITSGETGTGQYSGPGIIDSVAGTFDPLQANIGINTISYLFMTDDPVPCIGNQTIQIEVLETPTALFSPNVDTVCILDAITLTYEGTAGINSSDYTVTDGQTFDQSNPTITFTQTGEHTITLTVIKDGCESSEFARTVFVDPELEPVVIDCTSQEIDNVAFGWDPIVGATGYLVTVTNADGSVDPPFTTTDLFYAQGGLNPDDSISISITVISGNKCPGSFDVQQCFAKACPSVDVTINAIPTEYCVDGTNAVVDLSAIADGDGDDSGDFIWSGDGVTGTQFDPNGLPEGPVTINVEYIENGCGGYSDNITVNITQTPAASFDVALDPICVGSTLPFTFTGSNLPNQNIDWSGSDVTVTATANPNEYEATFNTEGIFNIMLDVTNGACNTAPAMATIIVEPELMFGPLVCSPAETSVSYSWDGVDCATEYEIFLTVDNGPETSQGIQSTTTFLADNLPEGIEVSIRVVAISDCACPDVMNTVTCPTLACIEVAVDVSAMGGDTDFCFADDLGSVDVLAELIDNTGDGSGFYSGTGVDPISGTFDPVAAGVGSHTILYTWIEPFGCEEFMDSITFNIFENPEVTAIADPIDCYDDTFTTLNIVPMNGDGIYTVTEGGVDIALVSEVMEGTFDILVTDGNNCTAETSVTVVVPAEPMPTITGSTELIVGESSNYSIEQSLFTGLAIDSIVWTANGSVICNEIGCFSLSNEEPIVNTTYEVTVFYNNGCSVVRSIEVEVAEPDPIYTVDIPNIISPNNDGENDLWMIATGDPEVIVNSVRILDRWGNLVFEVIAPYSPLNTLITWDGKYKNADLQPAVYVYSVTYFQDGRDRVRNGDITIIR
ncbi:MAG: gliding motility-associated-like protein [Saprospiraceae bacterium]|jgi:gliding motility-associated-like protein